MKSPIYGVGIAIGSTSAVRYSTLGSANSMVADNSQQVPMPCAGTFKELRPWMTTAPGSGKSWEYMLMKNNNTTDVASTVSGTALYNDNTTDTCAVSAGDLMSMRYTPSGTPASSGYQSHTLLFESSDGRYPILGGTSGSVLVNSGTRYISLHSAANVGAASTTYGQTQAPHACTIDRLYISLSGAPGADKSYTFTLQKNGSNTDVTVTISGDATTGNDTAHTVDVAEGDLLVMVVTPTGTPTAVTAQWGIGVTPDTDGESWQNYRNTVNIAGGETYIAPVEGAALTLADSERYTVRTPACTVKNLFPRMRTAPGSGNSIAFTFQKNTSDQTLTATIADTATVASDTAHTFTAADGDSLQVKQVVSASIAQAASYPSHSWVAYIAPAAGQTVTPSALSLSLTQQAATISYPVSVSPATLAMLLSLKDPTYPQGVTVTPNALALALALKDQTISYAVSVVAESLPLSLTQKAPTVSYAVVVSPSAFTLSLSQKAPTISYSVVVTPSAQGLTLAIKDPLLDFGGTIVSPSSLPLTLSIPDSTISIPMAVGVSTLTLLASVLAPTVTTAASNTTYIVYQNNRLELWVNGNEVARFNPDGSIDAKGAVNESAF